MLYESDGNHRKLGGHSNDGTETNVNDITTDCFVDPSTLLLST
jgi:hypothetical protein